MTLLSLHTLGGLFMLGSAAALVIGIREKTILIVCRRPYFAHYTKSKIEYFIGLALWLCLFLYGIYLIIH